MRIFNIGSVKRYEFTITGPGSLHARLLLKIYAFEDEDRCLTNL